MDSGIGKLPAEPLAEEEGDREQEEKIEAALESMEKVIQERYGLKPQGPRVKEKDVDIVRSLFTKQITLPEGMSLDEAEEWIKRKKEHEEKDVNLHAEIHGVYLMDALVAFHKALKKIYGFVDAIPTESFFGSQPPTMVTVPTGPNPEDVVQVPWGRMQIPGIAGAIGVTLNHVSYNLILEGKSKQKHLPQFQKIVAETERIVKTDSIYRGRSIKVSWQWERNGDPFEPISHAPRFLKLNEARENTLVFADSVEKALNIGLFTPIEHSDTCRQMGIPLRRGILLEGPYGCGKTLTALATAIKANRNGWTFIYLESVEDLARGLGLAHQYSPAIIFVEDIDKALIQDRTIEVNQILNLLDGMDTSSDEVITVFTTNHVEKLQKAFLRPGRLDMLIHISAPDAKAAVKLVELYGRGFIDPTANLKRVGEALAGKIPAAIREVVEKAKLATVWRTSEGGSSSSNNLVSERDLLDAAETMDTHLNLLNNAEEVSKEREISLRLRAGDLKYLAEEDRDSPYVVFSKV